MYKGRRLQKTSSHAAGSAQVLRVRHRNLTLGRTYRGKAETDALFGIDRVLSIYRTLKAPAVRSRRARVQAAYDIKDPSAGPRSRSQVKGIKAELSLALLVACAALLERLTDVTLAWLPLYNQAKLILWIWLLVSRNLVRSSCYVPLE